MIKKHEGQNFSIYKSMTDMGYKGTNLLVYAFIYSFMNTEYGLYFGSKDYIASFIGVTTRSVYKSIDALMIKGAIEYVTIGNHTGYRCVIQNEDSHGNEDGDKTQSSDLISLKYEEELEDCPIKQNEKEYSEIMSDGTVDEYYNQRKSELTLRRLISESRRSKPNYNVLELERDEYVSLTEAQYRELLRLVSPEILSVYIKRFELMLEKNLESGRPSPRNHYKEIRKWIIADHET